MPVSISAMAICTNRRRWTRNTNPVGKRSRLGLRDMFCGRQNTAGKCLKGSPKISTDVQLTKDEALLSIAGNSTTILQSCHFSFIVCVFYVFSRLLWCLLSCFQSSVFLCSSSAWFPLHTCLVPVYLPSLAPSDFPPISSFPVASVFPLITVTHFHHLSPPAPHPPR